MAIHTTKQLYPSLDINKEENNSKINWTCKKCGCSSPMSPHYCPNCGEPVNYYYKAAKNICHEIDIDKKRSCND